MSQIHESKRGRLKIFLSYAAGAGKTYRMLEEAQDLKSRGIDIVIGYFEPHGRKDTIGKTEGLEIIPRKKMEYRGSEFEEMDTGQSPRGLRLFAWSMNFRTPMFPDQIGRSVGKTC